MCHLYSLLGILPGLLNGFPASSVFNLRRDHRAQIKGSTWIQSTGVGWRADEFCSNECIPHTSNILQNEWLWSRERSVRCLPNRIAFGKSHLPNYFQRSWPEFSSPETYHILSLSVAETHKQTVKVHKAFRRAGWDRSWYKNQSRWG